jgi:hypothetical protein
MQLRKVKTKPSNQSINQDSNSATPEHKCCSVATVLNNVSTVTVPGYVPVQSHVLINGPTSASDAPSLVSELTQAALIVMNAGALH